MDLKVAWYYGYKLAMGLCFAAYMMTIGFHTGWLFGLPFALGLGLFFGTMWAPRQRQPSAAEVWALVCCTAICFAAIALGLLMNVPGFLILGMVVSFVYFTQRSVSSAWVGKLYTPEPEPRPEA